MAVPAEVVVDRYPSTVFKTNFDVYARVAEDMVRAVVAVELQGADFHKVATVAGHDAFVAAEQSVEALYANAGNEIALSRYTKDNENGNMQGLYELLYELAEATDPLPVERPLPVTTADRYQDDYVFIDSLRLRPRFSEGVKQKALYSEYLLGNEYADTVKDLAALDLERAQLTERMARINAQDPWF